MCGFAGFYSLDGSPGCPIILSNMTQIQSHRGPDDRGMRLFSLREKKSYEVVSDSKKMEKEIALEGGVGFNRLSILDLSSDGHQPMCNRDESIFVAYNGEVYNAFDFKKELIKAGYDFKSRTDTEVILYLYEHLGIEATLEKLNGMFSLCIVDLRKRKIWLARDHMGIKPLYIYQNENTVLFSSEVKSFYAHPSFKANIANAHLDEYLTFRYCSGENFLLEDVKQVKPGHLVEICEDSIKSTRYWQIPDSETCSASSASDRVDELDELLANAVDSQLISDVRLGSQLSGGIDSSLITAYASKKVEEQLETFSIVFQNESISEDNWISQAVSTSGVHSHRYMFQVPDLIKLFEKATWHLDQPINLPNSLGIYLLAEKSKELVTVLLSGEGADEVFGGYSRYYDAKIRSQIQPWTSVLKRIPILNNRLEKKFRLSYSADDAFILASSGMDESELVRLKSGFDIDRAMESRRSRLASIPGEGISRFLKYDMETYMVDLLIRQDKMTMAHSVENRVPFLDRRLVNFSRTLPENLLVSGLGKLKKNTSTKIVLKKLAEEHFDYDFVYRIKNGFPLPLDEFFNAPDFVTYMEEIILPGIEHRAILDIAVVRNWWSQIGQGHRGLPRKLWVAVAFEIWAQIFIDRSGAYPE